MTDAERLAIEQWHVNVGGEVPPYVAFLSTVRPGLLKAHWNRVSAAMSGSLPKQMLPFLAIQFNVSRALAPGIREGVLMGRGLGMTDRQISEAIGWGMLYGGPASVSVAADAIRDLPTLKVA